MTSHNTCDHSSQLFSHSSLNTSQRGRSSGGQAQVSNDTKVLNLSSKKRITGAKEILKELQLQERIMKEGLRHPATLEEKKRSWIRVTIV